MMAVENVGNLCTGRASDGKVQTVAQTGVPGVAADRSAGAPVKGPQAGFRW
jgi:hypothetical protein